MFLIVHEGKYFIIKILRTAELLRMEHAVGEFSGPLSKTRNIRYIFHKIVAGSDYDSIKGLVGGGGCRLSGQVWIIQGTKIRTSSDHVPRVLPS